jgi:hypothetical protein
MNESYEYADTAEFESAEWPGESSEAYGEAYPEYSEAWGEAQRRRRPPPVRTAPRQSSYAPRPSGAGYVTQTQFATQVSRFNAALATNSAAIKQVDGRVRGVMSEQQRQGMALRREIAERKKETAALQQRVTYVSELAAVIPLVTANASPTVQAIAPLAFLLPPDWLTGGTNGSGSGSGSSLLGSNNVVAIAVIAATLLSR